jgi:hypothetical protein
MVMVLIVIGIAIGSVTIGYLLGSARHNHPDGAALLHQLTVEIRTELLARQNWTSREILARLTSAVRDLTHSTVHELRRRHLKGERSSQVRDQSSRKMHISS